MKAVSERTVEMHLKAILNNPQWVEALNGWYRAGGGAHHLESPSLSLPLNSWQALYSHLAMTRWFEVANGRISPTAQGRDFLTRVNELYGAIRRENREDKVVTEILADLPRGAAVDIGCGPGHSCLRLAKLGYSPIHGYDLSTTALDIAGAVLELAGSRAQLYARDATPLSEIESRSLALVYSRIALHYFRQGELAKTLNRTLRPGGYVVAELVGLRYYLQAKHLRGFLSPRRWWQPLSYWRTVFRTLLYEVLSFQPRLAAGAPEIGFTRRSIHRLARRAGLEVISISPAPSSVGYFAVMKKRVGNVS